MSKLREAIAKAELELQAREDRAYELALFASGVEAANPQMREYAQRARVVADDLVRTLHSLRQERSLRVAMQEERDRTRALLAKRAPWE